MDDDPGRQLSAEDVIYARSSSHALQQLKQEQDWDEIWLDHDLGGDDSTMPVVDYLVERAIFEHPVAVRQIIVHTANPVGRAKIVQTLQSHYPVKVIAFLAQR